MATMLRSNDFFNCYYFFYNTFLLSVYISSFKNMTSGNFYILEVCVQTQILTIAGGEFLKKLDIKRTLHKLLLPYALLKRRIISIPSNCFSQCFPDVLFAQLLDKELKLPYLDLLDLDLSPLYSIFSWTGDCTSGQRNNRHVRLEPV